MRSEEFFQSSTLTSKETIKMEQQSSNSHNVSSQVMDIDALIRTDSRELYGELVVFGTTPSRFPGGNSARRRSKLQMRRRHKPNGVTPHKEYYSNSQLPPNWDYGSVTGGSTGSSHVVSYSLSRSKAYVVEYADCEQSDMFQVGRSTESNIDMVLIDTVPGATRLEDCTRAESTISRYACRITVDRSYRTRDGLIVQFSKPRIYAAGFDHNRSIQLGEKALKWQVSQQTPNLNSNKQRSNEKDINKSSGGKKSQNKANNNNSNHSSVESSQHDGLTTNGVLILNPDEKGSFKNSVWREVSICGHIYTMRDGKNKTVVHKVHDETNELRDGCLIDLCGTTLLWRSADNVHSLTDELDFVEKVQKSINNKRPQCPISFNTLYLPKSRKPPLMDATSDATNIDWDSAAVVGRAGPNRPLDNKKQNNRRHSRTPLPEVSENNDHNNHQDSSTISRDPSFSLKSRPYACFPCGHVYGYFDAPPASKTPGNGNAGSPTSPSGGQSSSSAASTPSAPPVALLLEGIAVTQNTERECPLCREKSVLVGLSLGDEPAFHMDSDEPTYAFNPCGHTCSLATAKHWSSVLIPSSNGGKRQCPFCAITMDSSKPYVSLIFQDRFI
ncbi:E3 ubiquitin-protein ligase pellino homolog 1-like isoform X2 [Convolutriloba macropyga]